MTSNTWSTARACRPSQAPIEAILKVDLYGTAVLLEEVGKVIAQGGCGVTISSQSGWRMPQLTAEQDRQLAMTPTEELLSLDILQPENIRDTLHAYQMAKRCNEKRVMFECVRWGERGARLNDIAPGIIVTPLAIDEFNGPRGDFYKNIEVVEPAGLQRQDYVLLIDEESKLKGDVHFVNCISSYLYDSPEHGDIIIGNAMIVKQDEEDLRLLTQDEAIDLAKDMSEIRKVSIHEMTEFLSNLKRAEKQPEKSISTILRMGAEKSHRQPCRPEGQER